MANYGLCRPPQPDRRRPVRQDAGERRDAAFAEGLAGPDAGGQVSRLRGGWQPRHAAHFRWSLRSARPRPTTWRTSFHFRSASRAAAPPAGRRFTTRITCGLFADATGAYSWRSNVTLDRPAYFTDGQLFLTDQVAHAGRPRLHVPRRLHEGPLHRSPSPTRSRTRAAAATSAARTCPSSRTTWTSRGFPPWRCTRCPGRPTWRCRWQASRVLSGRNVGQSTTLHARAHLHHPFLPASRREAPMTRSRPSDAPARLPSSRSCSRRRLRRGDSRPRRCLRAPRRAADAGAGQLADARPDRARPDRRCRRPRTSTSDAYQAELAAIKTRAGQPDGRAARVIDYWSGGGILRWNQILRELVAKLQPPARAARRRHLSRPRRGEPVRGSGLPVLEPALRGARLQLRDGRAVRGPEVRLVVHVPVQPAVAGARGQRGAVADVRDRHARLSVRRRGPVRA